MKYRVHFSKMEYDYIDVEADDEDTALRLAENQMGSSWDFDDMEELNAQA